MNIEAQQKLFILKQGVYLKKVYCYEWKTFFYMTWCSSCFASEPVLWLPKYLEWGTRKEIARQQLLQAQGSRWNQGRTGRSGNSGRCPKGRQPKEEKFMRAWRHLYFWVFLSTDLHFLQFVGRFGQIVPGPKDIASPPLDGTMMPEDEAFLYFLNLAEWHLNQIWSKIKRFKHKIVQWNPNIQRPQINFMPSSDSLHRFFMRTNFLKTLRFDLPKN